jgi:hypothetical protein
VIRSRFGERIDVDHERLFALSGNIRTFTEQNVTTGTRAQIKQAIDRSRIVVFLGFGFHQQNLTLLQTGRAAEPWRRVLASVLKIDPANFDALKRQIANVIGCQQLEQVQLLERYCHQLMPTMKPSLMATL